MFSGRENLYLDHFVFDPIAFAFCAIDGDITLPPKFPIKHTRPFDFFGQWTHRVGLRRVGRLRQW